MVFQKQIEIETQGFSEIHDLTPRIAELLKESRISAGLANIFAVGSTASITTIEFEPALNADMRDKLEEIAPHDQPTRHGDTWGDDNGFSHLRASFMGPGITVPVEKGRLVLGTWQQIVVIDHDNRPRTRPVHITIMGE